MADWGYILKWIEQNAPYPLKKKSKRGAGESRNVAQQTLKFYL